MPQGRTGAQLWAIVRDNLRDGLWSKRSAWGKVTAKSQLFKLAQAKYLEEVESFFRCAALRFRAITSAACASCAHGVHTRGLPVTVVTEECK